MPRKYNKDIPRLLRIRTCVRHLPTLRLDCFEFKVTVPDDCGTCNRRYIERLTKDLKHSNYLKRMK